MGATDHWLPIASGRAATAAARTVMLIDDVGWEAVAACLFVVPWQEETACAVSGE